MSRGGIGYFGGTFDPPHLGHIILASEARYQLGLDQMNWIITPDPPHKTDRLITSQNHRWEMLKRVVEQFAGFEISDIDLRRPPPHFAADTVEILKNENPEQDLIYVIGEDSLRDLPGWHEPIRFLTAIDRLAVYSRPGIESNLNETGIALPGIKEKVIFLEGIEIDISSSLIRERAAQNGDYEHLLLKTVADYIQGNGLYEN